MERSRPAPPTSAADADLASPPTPRRRPSLGELIQQARAPDAGQDEVNALLRGLARPLAPEQSPREHADLLLSLIGDTRLGDFTGSNGRTVRGAAVQALVELGYPYALEVPPEALAARDFPREPRTPGRLLSTTKGRWGFGLIMATALFTSVAGVLLLPALLALVVPDHAWSLVNSLAVMGGTAFIPAALMVWGHNRRSRWLKGLGNLWLFFVGVAWVTNSLIAILNGFPPALAPMFMGGVMLTGAWLMNSES